MNSPSAFTLLTGATSGIGGAIAARISPSRRLVLHGRNAEELEQTRAACANPQSHLIWIQDLKNPAGIGPSLENFLQGNGANVDCLIHCAGQAHLLAARSAGLEVVMESLNVNYVSAQQIIATLLKKRANSGALRNIVAVSSISSRYGVRGYSLYCASKAALDGLVRALAVELAPHIRVNSVLPGAVLTSTTEAALSDPQMSESILKDYPLGIGRPTDVADMVEFLISEKSRWITGQQFMVDGGFSIDASA